MRSPIPACLLLLTPLVLSQDEQVSRVVDRTGEGIAFVEWSALPTEPVVGQEVVLSVRCGVERSFFDQSLVQPFRQPLDLPVQLQLDGLEQLTGARLTPFVPSGDTSFVLGGEPSRARALEGHRRGEAEFVAVEFERTLTLTRPGVLRLPAPRLRFASASKFREDLVHGRVALDRSDAVVLGAPLELEVRDLPEEGRPPEFAGAIGDFELWAEVDRRAVDLGDELLLTLEVEGEGDPGEGLARWPARVPGFGVRSRELDGRRVLLGLSPEGVAVDEVPALSLVFFDPSTGEYRRAESEPIPISVGAGQQADDAPPVEAPSSPAPIQEWVLLIAAGAVVVAVYVWRRRSRGEPSRSVDWSGAADEARARLVAGEDPRGVLLGLLALVLGCEAPGVVGPRLVERLVSAGVAPELARRVADRLQAWDEARFGGSAADNAVEQEARELIEALGQGGR